MTEETTNTNLGAEVDNPLADFDLTPQQETDFKPSESSYTGEEINKMFNPTEEEQQQQTDGEENLQEQNREQSQEQAPLEEEEIDLEDALDIVNQLISDTGKKVTTLSELKELISKTEKELPIDLTEDELAMIKVGREKGDYSLYTHIKNFNPDTAEVKDVLWEKYKLDNMQEFREDPVLVKKLFEKEFYNKYENADDEELAQRMQQSDLRKAKTAIKEVQAKFQEYGKEVVKPQVSKEEQAKKDQEWYNQVDSAIKTLDKQEIKFKSGEKELSVNIPLQDKKTIQKIMDAPLLYLQETLTENGQVNMQKLVQFAVLNANIENILREVYLLGDADGREKFVKSRKEPDSRSTSLPNTTPNGREFVENLLTKIKNEL